MRLQSVVGHLLARKGSLPLEFRTKTSIPQTLAGGDRPSYAEVLRRGSMDPTGRMCAGGHGGGFQGGSNGGLQNANGEGFQGQLQGDGRGFPAGQGTGGSNYGVPPNNFQGGAPPNFQGGLNYGAPPKISRVVRCPTSKKDRCLIFKEEHRTTSREVHSQVSRVMFRAIFRDKCNKAIFKALNGMLSTMLTTRDKTRLEEGSFLKTKQTSCRVVVFQLSRTLDVEQELHLEAVSLLVTKMQELVLMFLVMVLIRIMHSEELGEE